MSGLFITGTDTGVGKTQIGRALAKLWHTAGHKVGVMKPLESGCNVSEGLLQPEDALALIAACGTPWPLDRVCPYRLQQPLAPGVAARLEGVSISLDHILACYQWLGSQSTILLAEGAGGIMVPISGTITYLDLAAVMNLPILVVARSALGTINHTCLTVNALTARGLSVAGVILNRLQPAATPDELTNGEVITDLVGVPVWGPVAFQDPSQGGTLTLPDDFTQWALTMAAVADGGAQS